MYRIIPYFFSKILVELPLLLLGGVIFANIVYFGIGTNTSYSHFLRFLIAICLDSFAGNAYGYLLSTMFDQAETAVMAAPLIALPLSLLGGIFASLGTIPAWVGWLQWISPVRYTFEALIYNEFSDRTDLGALNPIYLYNLTLGYGVCMVLLLTLSIACILVSLILLKLRANSFKY